MDKTDVRKYIKEKFKTLGFQSKRKWHYRIYDGDYLIGFELEPSTLCKGYCFTCGIIYLPDELRMPFHGIFDFHWDFIFPWEPDADCDVQSCINSKLFRRVFVYEEYSVEQLDKIFNANYDYFIKPLMSKEYGLNLYREDWRRLESYPKSKIEMICSRAGINTQEVLRFLDRLER